MNRQVGAWVPSRLAIQSNCDLLKWREPRSSRRMRIVQGSWWCIIHFCKDCQFILNCKTESLQNFLASRSHFRQDTSPNLHPDDNRANKPFVCRIRRRRPRYYSLLYYQVSVDNDEDDASQCYKNYVSQTTDYRLHSGSWLLFSVLPSIFLCGSPATSSPSIDRPRPRLFGSRPKPGLVRCRGL